MCMIDESDFDHTFNPTPKQVSFIKGVIFGSFRADPGNEPEFSVHIWWIRRNLPNADVNIITLMDAGYLLQISEQFDGAVTIALTHGAVRWCEQTGIIPATLDEREKSSDWANALTFDRKQARAGGTRRRGAKPTPKTTSYLVRQISYTPDEASRAYAEINGLYDDGRISERSAAGYKATVTRRIHATVAA